MSGQTGQGGGGGGIGRSPPSYSVTQIATRLRWAAVVVSTLALIAVLLVVRAEAQQDAYVAALIVGLLVYLLFASVLLLMRRSWLRYLPGLRSRRRWFRWASGACYVLLLLTAILTPLASYLVFNAVLAFANAQDCQQQIPLVNKQGWLRRAGWILWTACLLLVLALNVLWIRFVVGFEPSFPSAMAVVIIYNAVFGVPAAVFGLCFALWSIAADPKLSGKNSALAFLLVCLIPPLGVTRAGIKEESDARTRALFGLVLISWVSICVAIVVILTWALISQAIAGTLARWLSVVALYILSGLAVGAIAWIVRQTYVMPLTAAIFDPIDVASPAGLRAQLQLFPSRPSWLSPVVSLLVMGAWCAAIAAVAWLWIHAEIAEFAKGHDTGQLALGLSVIGLAGIPVTLVALRILVLSLPGKARPADGFFGASVTVPVVMSVLVVAVAFVFAGSLVAIIVQPWTMVIAGFCIGLGVGLTTGFARLFGVSRRAVVIIGEFGATGFGALVVLSLLIPAVNDWPNNALASPSWLALTVEGIVGLGLGCVLGGAVLVPGFVALMKVTDYFVELFWRLIGFVAGYVLIVLLFGGVYFLEYDSSPPACNEKIEETTNFELAPMSHWHICGLTFRDFAYFSMNTIAPLGYSDLRPRTEPIKTLTAVEVGTGISWTVIVFGLILTWLADQHVRKIVNDALRV